MSNSSPEQIRLLLSISKVIEKQADRADALNLTDTYGGEIGSMLKSYAEILRQQAQQHIERTIAQ